MVRGGTMNRDADKELFHKKLLQMINTYVGVISQDLAVQGNSIPF